MKLSFSLVPEATDLPGYVETVRRAEADGFDLIWTPDQGFMADPFVALALAGAATARAGLGLGITSVFMRHPMQIARAAGALANLTSGRFVLGLGAGEKARIRDRMGAPGGAFVPMTAAAIDTLRRLFAGETVTAETEAFALHGAGLEFAVQHPVPIHVATTAPEAFRMAGAQADGVIVGDVSDPEIMERIVGWIREGAAGAGRPAGAVEIVAWTGTILTDDPAPIRAAMRRPVAGTALVGMHRDTRALFGIDPDHVPLIKAARRDPSAPLPDDAIPDATIDRLALIGTADQVAARIGALAEVGVTMMGFRMPVALRRHVDFAANVRALAAEVRPRLAPTRR